MDKDQSEQPRKHYKLRSSLKRQSRNPNGNLDVTDEGQDVTLHPPPRRVSFAASRNVKPFLDDPDNNTIWDHTYEEAIISNTDSNNVASLDSHGNVQETIGEMQRTVFETDMELTCRSVQESIGNNGEMQKTIFETDMEFTCVNVQETFVNDGEMQKTFFESEMEFTCLPTNFTRHEEIDMSLTRIEQKENIHSVKLHAKTIKSRKTKPLGINATLMKSTTEDMTLVEPLNECNIEQPDVFSTKYASPTECQEVDMSLTCKFDNVLIVQNMQQEEYIHKPDHICDSNNIDCVSEQEEEISISKKPKPHFKNTHCPDIVVEKEIFPKPTKLKKAKSVGVQETDSIGKYAVDPVKPSKTISEPIRIKSHPMQENVPAKVPAIFVDSTNDFSLEADIPSVEKAKNKRIPFGHIPIAPDSRVEQTQTKMGQPLDKLSSTSELLPSASRSENLTLGETHKQSDPLPENKTLQENVIRIATPLETPAIFVDSINEQGLESKTLTAKKGKDKRIPFGHISIAADSKVEQPLDKLTIHDAVNYKNLNLPNSNIDEELSIVDLHDKDCTNIFTPPKVIYSEPMPAKTSFLDFTTGLSPLSSTGKKQFLNSTLDGTQQLIEATFSKPHRNKSGVSEMDNTNGLDSSIILAEYKPVKFDYASNLKFIRQSQDLQEKIKLHFEQESKSPKLRRSVLDQKVKRLSICNSCNTPKDQSTDDGVILDDLLFDSSISETAKSLHEKILDIFQNNVKHIVELHTFEENYYVCSAFANLVWFSVKLHAADGTVEKIIVSSAIEVDYSKSAWPALYDLVASFIINKLQMENLKSALGTNFDMLSLLDHIIILTERSSEFFVQLIETRFHLKTLDVSDDGTVSFKILLTDPPTIWTLAFKMASVETIQQDSLIATSRWSTINQEKMKTILRNTAPGIDCIRRFADSVIQYFRQTLNVPEDIRMI